MSFRTDLGTSFWPEVRHQATHPAAVTKPGVSFEEAVGIYRALVKANLPARPGDLALAASQVPIGSSRLMRPWWRIRRRCELFGPLDQFTATYGRYLRAVLADRLQILTQLGGRDQELDDSEAGLGRLTSTQQGVQRRPGLSPTGNVDVDSSACSYSQRQTYTIWSHKTCPENCPIRVR